MSLVAVLHILLVIGRLPSLVVTFYLFWVIHQQRVNLLHKGCSFEFL